MQAARSWGGERCISLAVAHPSTNRACCCKVFAVGHARLQLLLVNNITVNIFNPKKLELLNEMWLFLQILGKYYTQLS